MLLGRILILMAVLIAGLSPVFVRELSEFGWGAVPITGSRGLFGAIILGLILRSKITTVKYNIKPVFGAGMAITLGMLSYAYALQHAPMGLVIAIVFLGPIWVISYERLFRKIRNRRDGWACLCGFTGTALIAYNYNWQSQTEVLGFVSAFVSGIMLATIMITIDRATRKVSPQVVAFWTSLFTGVVLSWSLVSVEWNLQILKYSVLFGITNGALYMFLLYSAAKKIASASEISAWQYLEVATVWLVGVVGYNEKIHYTALLGTLFIVIAGIIIAIRKKE
jgi:drug/metabolite transporter (DMT)-like permease